VIGTGRGRTEGDIRRVLRCLRKTADTAVQDRRSPEYYEYVGVGNDPGLEIQEYGRRDLSR
jgi:hypothetical protein